MSMGLLKVELFMSVFGFLEMTICFQGGLRVKKKRLEMKAEDLEPPGFL